MSQRGIAASWRQVRQLFEQGSAGRISDAELVSRLSNDEARSEAITALVERHGPMVLGVCRRSLVDAHDVADAFQSTFLILLQKPGTVNLHGTLGPWLHGVARRVAGRLRTQRTQRGQRDGGDASKVAAPHDSADALEKREAVEALEAEIERLPEAFRNVIVLCELSGLSHDLAAEQLGCPVGTVESRLSRGRARLRQALTRRGFAPSLALLPRPDSDLIPQSLAAAMAKTALMPQAEIQTLLPIIQGVIADMTRHQLRTSVLKIASAALLCGLGFVAIRQLQAQDRPPVQKAQAPTHQAEEEAIVLQPPAKIRPGDVLKIEVLEALPGRPITGQRIVRPDGTISLGFYGDLMVAGLNRKEIKAKLIQHLQKFLIDSALGLEVTDEENTKNGEVIKMKPVAPADSDRVSVDDSANFEPRSMTRSGSGRTDSEKLDALIEAVEAIKPGAAPNRANRVPARGPASDEARRIKLLEDKLDRLTEEVQSLKKAGH